MAHWSNQHLREYYLRGHIPSLTEGTNQLSVQPVECLTAAAQKQEAAHLLGQVEPLKIIRRLRVCQVPPFFSTLDVWGMIGMHFFSTTSEQMISFVIEYWQRGVALTHPVRVDWV